MKKILSLILCMSFVLTGIIFIPAMADATITPVTSNEVIKFYSSKLYTLNLRERSDAEIVTNFVDPVVVENGITDSETSGYYASSNFKTYFNLFTDDKTYYLYDIPECMKDATFFRLKKSWAGTRNSSSSPTQVGTTTEALTFDINKTATVYYVYQSTDATTVSDKASWLVDGEWELCQDTVQYVSGSTLYNWKLYKKTFTVTDGQTYNVKIGGFSGAYLPPLVFVDWLIPETSNEMFKYMGSSLQNLVLEDQQMAEIVTTGFTDPVRKTGEGAITDPTAAGYYSAGNLESYFPIVTNTESNWGAYAYFNSVPDYLKDSTFFRLNRKWRGTYSDTTTNPNAMNAQTEVLTFDINATANVYYILPSDKASIVDTYAKWLNDEKWTLCDEKVEFVNSTSLTPSSEENLKPIDWLVFKKKFVVTPGEIENVKIGGFLKNYWTPFVFVDWVNESTTKNINVSVTGNGKVNKPGDQDVAIGEVFSVKATPDSGYVIDYIKFNGNDVVADAQGLYITPEISEDATIEIAFREIDVVPDVTSCMNVFNYSDENGLPSGITFAKVGVSSDYNVKEFGIVFSKTDNSPTIEEGGIKYPALSKNDSGQYGVQLYGNGLKFGVTYYTTPYTVYESIHGETVVYGTSTSFIPEQ